jgi:2-polyprenyl-3-methyl-5-hydroxy-6-metoxy-1,4-benzoquinol methylase
VFERTEADGKRLALRRCTHCDHVFLEGWSEPFPSELYDYYAQFVSREQCYTPLNTVRLRELLAKLGEHTAGRRLLDVGCGGGHLVHTATSQGWDALGIDLSKAAIDTCRRFGANCKLLDFFDRELDGQRFDVIVMSELLEHVPSPGRFFARAEQLLAPSGLLYLTTPNFDSLSRRMVRASWTVIHREHISYFTPGVMRQLVERSSGLRVVSIRTRNIALMNIKETLGARARRFLRPTAPPVRLSQTAVPDQGLRSAIEGSPMLRAAKSVVNGLLDLTGTGDALVVLCQRA